MYNLGLAGSELAKDFSQARRLDAPAQQRVKTFAASSDSLYALPVAQDLASTDERKALLFVDGFQNLVNLSFSDALEDNSHEEQGNVRQLYFLGSNKKHAERKKP